jgi:hypothetical protein
MKKASISVIRLALFLGVLVLLPHMNRVSKAQVFVDACQTFSAPETEPCPNNCTASAEVPIPPFSTGAGINGLLPTPWVCVPNGTSCTAGCCGTALVASLDAACCLTTGQACSITDQCCGDPGDTCVHHVCTAPTGDSPPCGTPGGPVCPGQPPSPIILDIDGKGFNLTSAAGGVLFDITGTGHPTQMGWTASGADNAFLALPGADGLVQNGQQLFGDFTPQPPSENPNGFAALAVYDDPKNGGNGDGIIDSRDAIFASLRLWIDANHDGISQPEELHTLASLGVNSISLKYKADQRTDQYGNVFHFRAQVNPGDQTNTGRMAYDVFFVTLPSTSAKNLIP